MAAYRADALANKLYYGDNLVLLREFPPESVDLVYLDPPFNSNRSFNLLFAESSAQRRAFDDTWDWREDTQAHYAHLTQTARHSGRVPSPVSTLVAALRSSLGATPMTAYVVQMAVRLVELHRVLKPTGSLYLHCDPTASHYLKLTLDAVFGPRAFVNEVTWRRSDAHNNAGQGQRRLGRVHDVLLWYAASDAFTFNVLHTPLPESTIETWYRHAEPETGRRYNLADITAPGGAAPEKRNPHYEFLGVTRYWRYSREHMQQLYDQGLVVQRRPGTVPQLKRYLDESKGVPLQDVWLDIPMVRGRRGKAAAERIGYPTQKPLALLQRIIELSSRPGDLVLDPFCGCGTAIDAAQSLDRRWAGIDNSYRAIEIMQDRMRQRHGLEVSVEGAPTEVAGARALAEQLPNGRDQFEAWALSLVGAVPHGGPQRKGADQGVDGVITFRGPLGTIESAIVSVKSGHVQASHIQQLKGAMETHGAVMGLFVTLEEPTRPMRREAAIAGTHFSTAAGRTHPRVQILTVRELLEERRVPDLPPAEVEQRATLWTEDELPPRRPRPRRRAQSAAADAQRTSTTPVPGHPRADTIRADYAERRLGDASQADEHPAQERRGPTVRPRAVGR